MLRPTWEATRATQTRTTIKESDIIDKGKKSLTEDEIMEHIERAMKSHNELYYALSAEAKKAGKQIKDIGTYVIMKVRDLESIV